MTDIRQRSRGGLQKVRPPTGGWTEPWIAAQHPSIESSQSRAKASPRQDIATILAFGKATQWQQALSVLRDMVLTKMDFNVFSYSAGISACEKGKQWQLALELLSEMRQVRVEPNIFSYSAGISACEKGRQWRLALELLGEMRQVQVETNLVYGQPRRVPARWAPGRGSGAGWIFHDLTLVSCNAGISACEKGEQWRRALALLGEMLEATVEPDVLSTALGSARAIRACSGSGPWRCSARCVRRRWSPTSSATVLGSARARSARSGNLLWRCSARCARRRWSRMSSATALGSARSKKAASGSRPCRCLARCGRRGWSPAPSATGLGSVRARGARSGTRLCGSSVRRGKER
ncbi:unnamed protein product [Prorocentrum cordatum]|uniref:Pentatricopeptide repeat-containing protein, chloroplastic n=1 Tax=Prorocentrum cordatum TaxID=2364126 RepID=A0ABN9RPQ4_9DINO|nr:unnamed protein product [Polarella glacialis]